MKDRKPEELAGRTKRFALAIVRLYVALPKSTVAYLLGRQVLKSGTSVGSHYREARRAKSDADFISKIEGALQELDETGYWLELLYEAGLVPKRIVETLTAEADELIAVFVTIVKRIKAVPT
jgi:four helix bundle protein